MLHSTCWCCIEIYSLPLACINNENYVRSSVNCICDNCWYFRYERYRINCMGQTVRTVLLVDNEPVAQTTGILLSRSVKNEC